MTCDYDGMVCVAWSPNLAASEEDRQEPILILTRGRLNVRDGDMEFACVVDARLVQVSSYFDHAGIDVLHCSVKEEGQFPSLVIGQASCGPRFLPLLCRCAFRIRASSKNPVEVSCPDT